MEGGESLVGWGWVSFVWRLWRGGLGERYVCTLVLWIMESGTRGEICRSRSDVILGWSWWLVGWEISWCCCRENYMVEAPTE